MTIFINDLNLKSAWADGKRDKTLGKLAQTLEQDTHRWKIRLSTNLQNGSLGETNPNTFEIKINPNQSQTEIKSTLWHEAAHAALSAVAPDNVNGHTQEGCVECIAKAGLQRLNEGVTKRDIYTSVNEQIKSHSNIPKTDNSINLFSSKLNIHGLDWIKNLT